MWMHWKKVLYAVLLAFLFSAPVTGADAEPTYQITEAELTQLETVFQQLKTVQQKQEKQIDALKIQLTESEAAIKQSETSLTRANESLKVSADEAKRTQQRIERQRDTWAAAAIAAALTAIFH